jgi:hypothetical protein
VPPLIASDNDGWLYDIAVFAGMFGSSRRAYYTSRSWPSRSTYWNSFLQYLPSINYGGYSSSSRRMFVAVFDADVNGYCDFVVADPRGVAAYVLNRKAYFDGAFAAVAANVSWPQLDTSSGRRLTEVVSAADVAAATGSISVTNPMFVRRRTEK